MIDKYGRILKKISIVDLFIICSIILIILFGILRIGYKSGISSEMQDVTIKFYSPALQNFTVAKLKPGAKVTQDATDVYLGEISSVKKDKSVDFNPDKNGINKKSSMDGLSSVEFTTKLKAYNYNDAVLISGHTYLVGQEIILWAGEAKVFLKISDIEFN